MIDVDPTKSESAARVAIRKYLYLVLGSIATVGVIAAIALAPIIGTGRLKENGKAIAHTYRLEKNLQDVLVMLRPVEINVGRYHLPSDSIPFGSIKTSLENLETERREVEQLIFSSPEDREILTDSNVKLRSQVDFLKGKVIEWGESPEDPTGSALAADFAPQFDAIASTVVSMIAKEEGSVSARQSRLETQLTNNFGLFSGMTAAAAGLIGTLIFLLMRDLRRRGAMELELRLAKQKADLATEAKTIFLANMSHEIRTPLTVVLGFADLMANPSATQDERTTFAASIKRNGRALGRLIDDILDLSKVEAGRLEVELVTFDLRDLISEIQILLDPRGIGSGVRLLVNWRGPTLGQLRSDPTRLRQILLNVIGNALKFTKEGSVELRVEYCSAKVAGPSASISFDVLDTGCGIDPAAQSRLFKPFSQADSTMTRRFGGTGLGLALSRDFARALGGDLVLVKSELNHGSTFRVTIACNEVANAGQPRLGQDAHRNSSALGPIDSFGLRGKRILIVDDAPDGRLLFQRSLEFAGASITTACDGVEAVTKARAGSFSLVLMDIQMPTLDGFAATKELRQSGYTLPIVALSAHGMAEEREQALSVGCDDYLTKPIERDLLLAMAAKHCRRSDSTVTSRPFDRTKEISP